MNTNTKPLIGTALVVGGAIVTYKYWEDNPTEAERKATNYLPSGRWLGIGLIVSGLIVLLKTDKKQNP